MADTSDVINAVYRAIDELNETLPPDRKVDKSLDTILSGPDGVLDSLGLVNLVVEAEQQIEDAIGITVNLADQKAIAARENPLQTLGSLVDYACRLMEGAEHE